MVGLGALIASLLVGMAGLVAECNVGPGCRAGDCICQLESMMLCRVAADSTLSGRHLWNVGSSKCDGWLEGCLVGRDHDFPFLFVEQEFTRHCCGI